MTDAPLEMRSLESAHFGFAVYAGAVSTASELALSLARIPTGPRTLLVIRVAADAIEAVHAIERAGGVHCDTLLTLGHAVGAPEQESELVGAERIRLSRDEDAPAVVQLAERAFRGFVGHWHADPGIPSGDSDLLYASWARDLALQTTQPMVVAHDDRDGLVGFLALRHDETGVWSVPLTAVSPASRGRGVLASMLREAMRVARDHAGTRFEYETQLRNRAALRSVLRCGFLPERSRHTFHLWQGHQ